MPVLEVSYQQLLKGVEHLNSTDFEQFAKDVLSIKAQRRSDVLPQNEADLLEKINTGISIEKRERYKVLRERKDQEVLTTEEYTELLAITKEKEQLNVERIRHLIQLAEIRKTNLKDLMTELGIS